MGTQHILSSAARPMLAPLKLRITGFEDVSAKEKQEVELSFDELADVICKPKSVHATKESCPLMKLGMFGDLRTDKGSLRHDANMLSVSGIEGDYDAGKIGFNEAAVRLETAGVEAILYTTASHTEDHPRWRILAPFTEEHTPAERSKFVARLNGIFEGVLGKESFTLSQTFYFGRVEGAEYRAERFKGARIDTCDDLDAGAIWPSDIKPNEPLVAQDPFALEMAKRDRRKALADISAETLEDLRDALLTGMRDEYAESYPLWVNVGQALKSVEQAGYSDEAVKLWHEFSARSSKYSESIADQKWDDMAPSRITYKSVFEWAQRDGWVNPRAAQPADYSKLEDWTDTGNANLLIRLTEGNLRYVPERGLWVWWDGSRWIADEFMAHTFAAAARVAEFYHTSTDSLKRSAAATGLGEDGVKQITAKVKDVHAWGTKCRSKHTVDNMLAMASRNNRVSVPGAELDKDPLLLGVANGVVDLCTGKLRDAARDEFVTKRSPVAFDPSAKAPRWCRFIEEVTGDPVEAEYDSDSGLLRPETVGRYRKRLELAQYMQNALGYCCTGRTDQHKMFQAIGAGSNGKNVLLDIVQEVLGDYCKTIPPEALMACRHDADAERPSPTSASLAGARLAISSESRDGQRMDVALVKRHTGGGFMTARLMRENTFRFEITHKLMLMTNHRPSLDHLDDALRGRLHLIPFDRTWNRPGHTERNAAIPDGDPGLMDILRAESQGILAWLIQGAVRYVSDGLNPPREVVRMTRSYFAEQDPVGRWIEHYDRCDPRHGTPAAELFQSFLQWHRDEDDGNGKSPDNAKMFSKLLESRGVAKQRTETARKFGLVAKKTAAA